MGSPPGVVGVVGCGLLGGSFARALKSLAAPPRVIAFEPDARIGAGALAEGVADEWYPSTGAPLGACDVVVLCAPVAAIEASLGAVSEAMRDRAVLSDVAGVKASIVGAARASVRRGVRFVGAHPMFGGETGGFAASRADLWRGGTVALCTDDADPEAFETIAALHRSLGATTVSCTADEHDAAVAMVSHLPYLVAHAFERAAGDGLARAIAGRGFADLTRLARFGFDIQGEVARRNPHLREAARRLRDETEALLDALDTPGDEARALFAKKTFR